MSSCGFCYSYGPQKEDKRNQKDWQIFRPCQRTKKAVEHEWDHDTNCSWHFWNSPKRLGRKTGVFEDQRKKLDHQDYRIVKIGQNTENSPGDLTRLAVSQIPAKDHQQTLVWKIQKVNNNKNNNNNKGV